MNKSNTIHLAIAAAFQQDIVKSPTNYRFALYMDLYFQDLIDRYTDNIISRNDTIYAIRVIGRGETLFFRENGKCLLCSIDAEHGIIYKKSIKSWDSTDEKMDRWTCYI